VVPATIGSGHVQCAVPHLQHRQQRAGGPLEYISTLEDCLGKKAHQEHAAAAGRDVPDTFADVDDLVRDVGYKPATPVEVGIRRFVDWYLEYYKTGAPQPTRVTNLG
jgi:dTDP-D-glucose 4,6-dehydratase